MQKAEDKKTGKVSALETGKMALLLSILQREPQSFVDTYYAAYETASTTAHKEYHAAVTIQK